MSVPDASHNTFTSSNRTVLCPCSYGFSSGPMLSFLMGELPSFGSDRLHIYPNGVAVDRGWPRVVRLSYLLCFITRVSTTINLCNFPASAASQAVSHYWDTVRRTVSFLTWYISKEDKCWNFGIYGFLLRLSPNWVKSISKI